MIIKRYYSVFEITQNTGSSRATIMTIINTCKIPINKPGRSCAVDISFYDYILDVLELRKKSGMSYHFINKLNKEQITELLEL